MEVRYLNILDRISFHRSEVYDFLASIFRLHCNEQLSVNNFDDLLAEQAKFNEELQNWVTITKKKIPNDIQDLISKFFDFETFYGICLIPCIGINKIDSILDFIRFVEEMDDVNLFEKFLYSGYGPQSSKIDKELIEKLLKDEKLAMKFINEELSIPSQNKWNLLQFFMNPENMRKEFVYLLNWYYENIYIDEVDRVMKLSEKSLDKIEKKIRKYGYEYLNLLTFTDYSKDKTSKEIIITVSYFYDLASFNSMGEEHPDVFMKGYRQPDVIIERKHALLSNVQMFKSLADETRLNIVKLLSKRPWYGHELAKELNLSNSTISYHLGMLVFSDFAKLEKVDNRTYYKLDPENMKRIITEAIDKML